MREGEGQRSGERERSWDKDRATTREREIEGGRESLSLILFLFIYIQFYFPFIKKFIFIILTSKNFFKILENPAKMSIHFVHKNYILDRSNVIKYS